MHSSVALILAGGFSSRMGGFKPLLPLPPLAFLPCPGAQAPCTALEYLARTYRAAGVEHFCVISGHRAHEVEAEARRLRLHSVRNASPEQGMFSSVCAGLRAVQGHYAFCFIHPVDIPLLCPSTVQRLWACRHAQRPCLPTFQGEEGHPLLLPAALWSAALRWRGEQGLHGWLHSLPAAQALLRLPVPDSLMLYDMDTDEDYAVLCELAKHRVLGNATAHKNIS